MTSDWKSEPHVVFDACALMAFFNDEPGAEIVDSLLQGPPRVEMSAVNLLEICYDAIRRTGDPQAAREVLDSVQKLPISIHWKVDQEVFLGAAQFKANYRISLADAFALALAKSLGAPVITSDHHEFDVIEKDGDSRFIWIR